MRIISCDGDCQNCSGSECELLLPYHQTLHKLNNRVHNTTYELKKVRLSIHYSLQNDKLNYPIYIGYTLQELRKQEKILQEQLHQTIRKRDDITNLLKRRIRK